MEVASFVVASFVYASNRPTKNFTFLDKSNSKISHKYFVFVEQGLSQDPNSLSNLDQVSCKVEYELV